MTGKYLQLVIATLLLAWCGAAPVQREASSNPAIEVDLLFEHEGVRMYRFKDGGRTHYYAVPANRSYASTHTSWTENCGKNCTRTVYADIPTVAGTPR